MLLRHLAHLFAVLSLLCFVWLLGVHVWGAAGHQIVATIAQIHLHPAVLPVLCDIFYPPDVSLSTSLAAPPCHLSSITITIAALFSAVPYVRGTPAYRWTSPLHYIGAVDDHPSDACEFPGERGWNGRRNMNVLAAVNNKTAMLGEFLDGERSWHEGEEALKYHMPLHLTGRERGGNGVKVTFDGRVTNLNSVWDNLLVAQALRTVSSKYTRPLAGAPGVEANLRNAIYDPYIRRIMHEGFGIGAGTSEGSGRFDEVDEWLSCPADIQSPTNEPSFVWRAIAQLAQKLQRMIGFDDPSLRVQKRDRAMRPRHHPGTAKQSSTSGWLWWSQGEGDRWDDEVLCPYAWASEIHKLNCELPVWPVELDANSSAAFHSCSGEDSDAEVEGKPRPHPDLLELDTPNYVGNIRTQWVLERLLAMAGIRLAGILNGLVLGSDPEMEDILLSPGRIQL
ncbi:phospholipase C/P1 nuclease [Laetiporus sulphureus 93-53]|uniref:Phospholipase C/P1 nuclease n=1 Tax=Laetiporus sulphureus 93-53 TaxID=1314785 RepID=A0A165GFJ9_9APHY|nr:phospholipase C/P1 nuclease [Laetiporus sulphureus 93-53]KZT10279.1 phospholipase C/P1 nuclease [Laetiporus sulphureus 93-53]